MFTPHHVSLGRCHVSSVMCQVSHISCHMSGVTCHVSCVTFLLYIFFCGQSGGASWWRVCYQRGLPVYFFTFPISWDILLLSVWVSGLKICLIEVVTKGGHKGGKYVHMGALPVWWVSKTTKKSAKCLLYFLGGINKPWMITVSRRIGTVGELGPLIRRIGTTLF